MPLIVIEGLDGSGKTTQLRLLGQRLRDQGLSWEQFRDPGGTPLGEQLRTLLLDPANEVCQLSELFGYLLARSQLIHSRIRPALAAGTVVVLDRFWYSTVAYQCYGLGLPRAQVQPAIDLANDGLRPAVALFLDLPAQQSLARRAAESGQLDRIESRGTDYLQRVYGGYQALVAEGALQAVDAGATVDEVAERIWQQVAQHLP